MNPPIQPEFNNLLHQAAPSNTLPCFTRFGEGPKVPKASHRSHPMAAAPLNDPNLHFWDVPVSSFRKGT